MTQHNVRVSARTAELTAASGEGEDGAHNWRFGGVAVGEGDILYTDDGTPVLFTAEVLAEYAETQADEPLSIDHPSDESGEPIYPPPLEESPGRVVKAGYVPGKGLVYEASTHEKDIAAGVRGGSYEVSVHPSFDLGEQDPETGAYIPTNVDFLDLSLVSKGMSPSNTAEWGANHALASWTRQADIGAELEAAAELTASATHTPSYSGTNSSSEWSKPSLEDYNADEPSEVTSKFLATTASSFSAVETYDQLKLPVVNPENELQLGALTSAHQMAGQVDGLSDEDVSRVRSTIERLAAEEFDEEFGEQAEAEASAEASNPGGIRALARELLAEYRAAQAQAQAEAESRPGQSESQSQSSAQTADEGPDSSSEDVDTDTNTMTDNNNESDPDEQNQEPEAEAEETPEAEPEVEDEEPEAEEPRLSEMTVPELAQALKGEGFLTADNLGELEAQKNKAERVSEIIEASDEFSEDDRDELMASSETLLEREHQRATGSQSVEASASLPGMAGGARSLAAQAEDDDEAALDEYGTGVSQ